ncbi:MAG: adenylate/guanylate cyclase domain-containing protein [Candidatus Limnocylindria bacterium]
MTTFDRYASIGCDADDDPDTAVRKRSLTIAATIVTILAFAWTGTFVLLDRPSAAVIPLSYQVVSVIGLVALWWTKRYDLFRAVQLSLMLVLPFILQWVLGGFEQSSAVSLWALVAAFGAVYFLDARRAIPWFLAYIGLVAVSGVVDPSLAAGADPLPDGVRTMFWVLNMGSVAAVAYILLQYFVRDRERARAASDALLRNILPDVIARRLKALEATAGPSRIADRHPDVTVLFADIVDFTPFAERTGPDAVVDLLDQLFTAFDALVDRHGLEKIKTIGDAYMVAGGLPTPRPDHAEAVARMALDMLDAAARLRDAGLGVHLRIGVETGPVVAGVIGRRKFSYDVWGDTVNMASRMESHGERDAVTLGPTAAGRLAPSFRVVERAAVEIKGKGVVTPSHLVGPAGPG